jgi:hypothetical protein
MVAYTVPVSVDRHRLPDGRPHRVALIGPPQEHGYTKMRPVVDWWSILRPVVYLGLGLKK